MAHCLKSGDQVKIISGDHKGESGKIVKIDKKSNKAMVEGIGIRTRHLRRTQWNPAGGKKDIHTGIHLSNLRLVESTKSAQPAAKPTKKSQKETK